MVAAGALLRRLPRPIRAGKGNGIMKVFGRRKTHRDLPGWTTVCFTQGGRWDRFTDVYRDGQHVITFRGTNRAAALRKAGAGK